MGELIDLAERRELLRRRAPAGRAERVRAQFFFDLACPFTYLAAERVERSFDDVVWTPAAAPALRGASAGARRLAEERAAALRLPLVWPDRHPAGAPAAMRVAALAAERGRGAAFVLAATRLAFCGGYDLDDPETLAEAAAAAGIPHEACAEAAVDVARDAAIEGTGRALVAAGADRLPGLRIGRTLYWGERRAGDAVLAARYARVAQG